MTTRRMRSIYRYRTVDSAEAAFVLCRGGIQCGPPFVVSFDEPKLRNASFDALDH